MLARENLNKYLMTVAWSMLVYGSLKMSEIPGHWGHGLCGPWGCAPPVQSLVACHLGWLITLIYVTEMSLQYKQFINTTWLFRGYFSIAAFMLTGLFCYEYFTWYLHSSDYQKSYFAQRLGFSLITHIDLPMLELIFASAWVNLRTTWLKVNKSKQHADSVIPISSSDLSPTPE